MHNNEMCARYSLFAWLLLSCRVAATAFQVVSCDVDEQTCTVRLDLTEGLRYVELIRDTSGVFAPHATTSTGIYGDSTPITGTRGHRYHTRLGEKYWGTAWISDNDFHLVEGIFFTEGAGVVEWPKQGGSSRSLQHVPSTDLVLELPEGRPWLLMQQRQVGREAAAFNASQYGQGEFIPFFPDCYPQDSVMHVIKLNIVYDAGLYAHLTAGLTGTEADKQRHVLAGLETVLAPGKLIMLAQLNVRVEVQRVIFSTVNDPVPFSRGVPGSSIGCVGAPTAMNEFMRWLGENNPLQPTGYWLLLSNCFGNVNGVSYIGSLCSRTSNGGVAAYAWSVMFHELGHALGSTHSFEHGVGLTGGLMDYGNTRYNGISQFHPLKRPEMCSFLSYMKQTASCPFFAPAPSNSSCGDGILSNTEACECLEKGVVSCGKCVQCQLTDPLVECASDGFVVRHAESPPIVIVDRTALSSPECCFQNRLAPPKTLCGGRLNSCGGSGGKCVPTCTLHLLTNTPNCGFDESGCMLGCVWKSRCRFDITYPTEDGAQRPISALPDGTTCFTQAGLVGQCFRAQCSSSTPPTSLKPTNQPSTSLKPTSWPTAGNKQIKCRKKCRTMQCRRLH